MKVTMVIWDVLLLAPSPNESEMLVVFVCLTKLLKHDLLKCSNISQMTSSLREKGLNNVHEYDMYLSLFNYYKEKPMD